MMLLVHLVLHGERRYGETRVVDLVDLAVGHQLHSLGGLHSSGVGQYPHLRLMVVELLNRLLRQVWQEADRSALLTRSAEDLYAGRCGNADDVVHQ